MTNIYQEWTLEDDQSLWYGYETEKKSNIELAVLLGRGLGGVQARLEKLRDVDSAAYARLFVQSKLKCAPKSQGRSERKDTASVEESKKKLVPAGQVLRRIQWDYEIDSSDFSVLHFDRVDETIVESPFDAANENISGRETRLVDALPEHRILAIKFRERVVWDRRQRLDLVFGKDGGDGQGLHQVVATYDEWKRQRDAEMQLAQQRWSQVSNQLRMILGLDMYAQYENLVKSITNNVLSNSDSTPSIKSDNKGSVPLISKLDVERFVNDAGQLLKDVRQKPDVSLDPTLIPTNDYDALDLLSEWIVLAPEMAQIKPVFLKEINERMDESTGGRNRQKANLSKNRPLPELKESDLEETYVRGSGPGGQKINKTNNCVDLLHIPTQLRVQCQETRSLPQNRKIARRRLRQKLDEYLNGSQSKKVVAEQKAATRKAKAKSRSRSKHKRIKEERLKEKLQTNDDDGAFSSDDDRAFQNTLRDDNESERSY